MKEHQKISVMATVILLMVIYANVSSKSLFVSTADQATSSSLVQAENAVGQAFTAVLGAESAGANVKVLLIRLNEATTFLAQAEVANRTGDVNTATDYANMTISISSEVNAAAATAKETTLISSRNAFFFELAFSVVFVLVLVLVWRRFRRQHI